MDFNLRTIASRGGKLAGMLVPIGVGVGASRLAAPYLPGFTEWVHTLGVWAPAAFIVGYVAASVLMMPAFLLTIAGGAVFGVAKGSLLVFVGSVLGGSSAFLLGRHVLRDWVAQQVARHPTMVVVDRVVGQEGLKLMFLLRLSGVVPYVLTNYAMGVTKVTLRHFLLAMLGMLPTIATYTALGQAGVASGQGAVPGWVLWMGIGATVLLAVTLTRIAQRALKEAEARTA